MIWTFHLCTNTFITIKNLLTFRSLKASMIVLLDPSVGPLWIPYEAIYNSQTTGGSIQGQGPLLRFPPSCAQSQTK